MQSERLQQLIHDVLVDTKGQDISVLDVRPVTDIADYLIIVSGTSSRHVSAMADKVVDKLREQGERPLGVEGQDTGDWVLIDYGDVIVHLMRPETRLFYGLEKLWGGGGHSGRAENES